MPAGLFHENYRTDERIFQTWFVRIWLIAFLIGCAVFPIFASKYMISTMIEVGIAIIACHGLNLLTGFTGQISLGHAAFMGVGAYTSSILVSHGVPFECPGLCRCHGGLNRHDFRHSVAPIKGTVPGHGHHRRPVYYRVYHPPLG